MVCLAALEAINHGRRRLWALRAAAEARAPAPAPVPPAPEEPPAAVWVRGAAAAAVACFWESLVDFAALGSVPAGWEAVTVDDPFLCLAPAGGRLRVRRGTSALA